MTEYNVYCDESCHLENDEASVMVLGGVYCPKSKCGLIREDLNKIKASYSLTSGVELKWAKVSFDKRDIYIDFIKYFFNSPYLNLRVLVADKTKLNHVKFNQTHDDWYYKMYYNLVRYFFWLEGKFNIYIDIKDRYSNMKAKELLKIFHRAIKSNPNDTIKKVQPIRSNETPIMELTDILIGAFGYANRFEVADRKNLGKVMVIQEIEQHLPRNTLRQLTYNGNKINAFYWDPNHAKNN